MCEANKDNSNKIQKKQPIGKKIGLVAFVVSELLALFVVGVFLVSIVHTESFEYSVIKDLLFFQGTIFAVTWGAKASSNFAKKGKTKDD